MSTNPFDLFGFGEASQGPITPVDPADLQSVWKMQREIQTGVGAGPQTAISQDLYKRACKPDADVTAVWYRISMVHMLQMLGMLTPWVRDGIVADSVFKVAATFPMEKMAIGVPQSGLPFDVKEFLSQVASS